MDFITMKERYMDACRRHGILPNMAICSSLFMVSIKDFQHDQCILEVSLDSLKDSEFIPLFDLFTDINNSVIDGVDVYNRTPCVMNGGYVLSLLRAINKKLRAVHLIDLSLEKGFLRDLSQRGLTCKELNLSSSRLRKLNLTGSFEQLQTLNLDFNTSLTSFQESCFSSMPNLKRLSVCATRVSNLWTTTTSLSKLPSLVELRFQNCLCCNSTGLCPESTSQRTLDSCNRYNADSYGRSSSVHSMLIDQPHSTSEEMFHDIPIIEDPSFNVYVSSPSEYVSEDPEGDVSNYAHELGFPELLSNALHNFDMLNSNAVSLGIFSTANEDCMASGFYDRHTSSLADSGTKKYLTHHPSPICFEKHYRDFMIASLPKLQILDNLPINISDRDSAKVRYSEYFEHLACRRQPKEGLVSILSMREINARYPRLCKTKPSCHRTKSAPYYSRSLGAAKVSSSAWPLVRPLSTSGYIFGDENKSFRPRQFEYHPSDSALMAFGTLDGEVVVVNHENAKISSYIPSLGAMNSILGLCWLKKFSSKLIAGSDNGSLRLYDTRHWRQSTVSGRNLSASDFVFDEFDQLTSVHVNTTDELFVASGYSKNVALYDINTGKRLNVFADMHQQHINVVKFSNHSPSVFATSSFDQDVKMWDLRQGPFQPCFKASSSQGNVMVCFSPDDLYLLVSAVDNEVKQLSAVDGRLLLDFEITATGSSQNYTRSYYMNGRDYIISGSCDENVVRICCAQTGRRLRDISLEGKHSGASMFVQSLRGDPFRDFNMSILAAYMRPSSKSEIIKVNLMASSDCSSDQSDDDTYLPSFSMGG
ncbi:hypothetical protein RND81_06G192700 [Saponaria officinalis]|uniref:U2A'/phosphoprotein 32 family A C-terminal domain-containing protein n=1 Tax=Saponaria officinalis TaxID=3572 RepID=A0AAW1KEN0_SAPOF